MLRVPERLSRSRFVNPWTKNAHSSRRKHRDHAAPAGPALSAPGDALLDDAAAQVGIDQSPPGAHRRTAQRFVGYPLPAVIISCLSPP